MVMVRGIPIHIPVTASLVMDLSWLASSTGTDGPVIWVAMAIGVIVVVKVATVAISVTGKSKVVAVVMADMVTVCMGWPSLGRMEPSRREKLEVRQVEGSQDHLSGRQGTIRALSLGFAKDPGDGSVSDTRLSSQTSQMKLLLTLLALLRTLR